MTNYYALIGSIKIQKSSKIVYYYNISGRYIASAKYNTGLTIRRAMCAMESKTQDVLPGDMILVSYD